MGLHERDEEPGRARPEERFEEDREAHDPGEAGGERLVEAVAVARDRVGAARRRARLVA